MPTIAVDKEDLWERLGYSYSERKIVFLTDLDFDTRL